MEASKIKEHIAKCNAELKNLHANSKSVSSIIEALHEKFDKEKVAKSLYEKQYDKEGAKYYNMQPEEIIKLWDDKAARALSIGKSSDKFIKLLYEDCKDAVEEYRENFPHLEKYFKGALNFYNDYVANGILQYVCREATLYHAVNEDAQLKGRIDALFACNSELLIVDWKTNESIDICNKFKTMYGPLYDYDDCNFIHYSLQLAYYKLALQETYHVTNNIRCCIAQLGANNDKGYVMHPIKEFKKEELEDSIKFACKKMSRLNS